MEIDLTKLNQNECYNLDTDFTIDLTKYKSKDIVALQNLHVSGYVKYNIADNLELNLTLTGLMTLKDSVTLEHITKNLNIEIKEEISLNDAYFQEYYEKEQNILDIMAILWENIVLEVPISLTNSSDLKLSGDGWSFGEKVNKEDNIDPRLASLAKLLDEGKE